MKYYSLWRCPNCIKRRRPAYELHTENAKRIVCEICQSYVYPEVQPNARKYIAPQVRKVAIIATKDPMKVRALLIDTLNEQLRQGLQPNVTDLLSTLQQEGVLTYELCANPQLL